MKLLGKEVKVGTRVRTYHDYAFILHINLNKNIDYPFIIKKKESGEEYTVSADGQHLIGETDVLRDIVEVLEDYTHNQKCLSCGECFYTLTADWCPICNSQDLEEIHNRDTELELKNYRLTLENELLAQEVQELRQQLTGKKEQCQQACEANLSLLATIQSMQGDLCKLTNDLYEAKANAAYYKRILTGLPASSSLTEGE